MTVLDWLKKKIQPPQKSGCCCYCPGCTKDLTKMTDVKCWDDDCVVYVCTCGVVSRWDFDVPVPILIGWE